MNQTWRRMERWRYVRPERWGCFRVKVKTRWSRKSDRYYEQSSRALEKSTKAQLQEQKYRLISRNTWNSVHEHKQNFFFQRVLYIECLKFTSDRIKHSALFWCLLSPQTRISSRINHLNSSPGLLYIGITGIKGFIRRTDTESFKKVRVQMFMNVLKMPSLGPCTYKRKQRTHT